MIKDPQNYRTLAFSVIFGVFILIGLTVVYPFTPAILWALVLSILMNPIYKKIKARFAKMKDGGGGVASVLTTLLTLLIIALPLMMVGGLAGLQLGGTVKQFEGQNFDQITTQVENVVNPYLERYGLNKFDISNYVEENNKQIAQAVRGPAAKFATQLGITLFTLVIALLSMFFFLKDSDGLFTPAQELSGLSVEKFRELLDKISETVHAVFVGTVLVAIIQGAIITTTYALLGVPNWLLLGIVSGVLCIVPLLGAPVIYIPVGLYFLSTGNLANALWIFGVGFLIVSQIDNVLRPFFIGSRVNLHPMAIFFFVLGGIALVGPIGLMVGPMLLIILITLQDFLRERLKESKAQSLEANAG